MKRSIVATSALLFAVAVLSATHVNAQSSPVTRLLSDGLGGRGNAILAIAPEKANHIVYGRLGSVTGKMLTLQARSGRIWQVNATDAIDSGNYQAPLSVGQTVEVHGYFRHSHTLSATLIKRIDRLDDSLPRDR